MSLRFIAFHMGPYQQDTQHLSVEGHGAYFLLLQHCWTYGRIPLDDANRAGICKVTVARWRKQLAPLVAHYFDAKGENKRATKEIAKAEKLQIRQAMAGHKGGIESAKRRTGTAAMVKPRLQPRSSHGSSHGVATKKEDITTTFLDAARAQAENPTNSSVDPNQRHSSDSKTAAGQSLNGHQNGGSSNGAGDQPLEPAKPIEKSGLASPELAAIVTAKRWAPS